MTKRANLFTARVLIGRRRSKSQVVESRAGESRRRVTVYSLYLKNAKSEATLESLSDDFAYLIRLGTMLTAYRFQRTVGDHREMSRWEVYAALTGWSTRVRLIDAGDPTPTEAAERSAIFGHAQGLRRRK
jgi:hypothetical protein